MKNLSAQQNLKRLREQIDKIDQKLLKLLAERFKITQKVGEYKKKYKLPPEDKKREREIFQKLDLLSKKLGLDAGLVKEIFRLIIKNVKKRHKKIQKER